MADEGYAADTVAAEGLFSIEGKVALVTGGSRGIGRMIAEAYVKSGAKVYISSRKAEACDAVAKKLSEIGECIALPADLSTEEGCIELTKSLVELEPALHILVNNAGANWGEDIATFPGAAWDKVLGLNVKSPFMLTRDLIPSLMKASKPGDPARVINIGSIDGIKTPRFETYAYSASKAAFHQLTRHLALQLAPTITVNAIAPGPFESKMTEYMFEHFMDTVIRKCPMGRIGNPDDMAGLSILLASRAGAYMTGTVIPVDGGICIR